MRVVTLNANGIRAAARKGFYAWLEGQGADVVCLQEVRADAAVLAQPRFHPPGWHGSFHSAERKGYSGVAVYSRRAPEAVVRGLGAPEWDAEGRYLELRFPGLSVVSVYVPSGSAGEERQQRKYAFLDRFLEHLQALRRCGREYVLCGDWNIAHRPIDLRNWKSNQKNSGFLPEERAWMDRVLGETGYVDAFRVVEPGPDHYTWWSNRGQAWARNVGWRIDYQIVTPGLAGRVRSAEIYRADRFSDHAPLTVDYALAG